MPKYTPLQTVHNLDEAFNRGDLEAVLNCYEEQAIMVIAPGKIAHGKDELRKTFQDLLKLGLKARQLKIETLNSTWRINGASGPI